VIHRDAGPPRADSLAAFLGAPSGAPLVLAAGIGLLCLFVLLLYRPGLDGDFVFDDFPNLVENAALHALAEGDGSVAEAAFSTRTGPLGRPLAMASFALQVWLDGGLLPARLKLVNLLLHLAVGVALLAVLARLDRALPSQQALGPPLRLLIGGLWLLAAMHVGTVLYVVQRMEILAALFVALGLFAYLSLRTRLDGRMRPRLTLWGALLALTLLGGLAKETALLLPALCALTEVVLLRYRGLPMGAAQQLRRDFWLLVVLPALLAAAWVLYRAVQPETFAVRDFGPWERTLTQGPILLHYLRGILLPSAAALPFYYDHWQAARGLLDPPSVAGSWLVLAALATLALALLGRRPWIAFGILWYFLGHILTSAPLPLELAFEHRNYLPAFGVFIVLADALRWALSGRLPPAWLYGLLTGALFWQAAVLAQLALDWRDPLRHAQASRERAPLSPRAHYEFGRLLFPLAEGLARDQEPRRSMIAALETSRGLPRGQGLAEVALILDAARHDEDTLPDWWDSLAARLSEDGLLSGHWNAVRQLATCVLETRCRGDDPGLARLVRLDLGRGMHRADNALLLAWAAHRGLGDFEQAARLFGLAFREGGLDQTGLLAWADSLARSGQDGEATAVLRMTGQDWDSLEAFRRTLEASNVPSAADSGEERPADPNF
jgi:hypothetical protein